jgi:hypothetical protein
MSGSKLTILALIGLCLFYSSNATIIYCNYPFKVPQNVNGGQGVFVDRCTGSVTGNTSVRIGHYDCGNAQLNVALIVEGYQYGPIRIGPGEKKWIDGVGRGIFGVKISLQSGSASSCKLEVLYV